MDPIRARRLLSVALGVGVLADLLLDGSALGINLPILVAAVLAAAWLLRRRGRRPDPLDAWLPVSALALAGFVAVRADPFVAVLDLFGAAACTGASIAAFSGLAVTRRSASAIAGIGLWTLEGVLAGGFRVIGIARVPRDGSPRSTPTWLLPVIRGLVIAVPLALIFGVLFASADPIFRRGFDDVVGFRLDLGDLPGRVVFVFAVTWLTAGLLWIAATGIPAMERSSLGAAARSATATLGGSLGTTESIVVLLVVDVVVGLFVGLQLAYLFGGLDTLAAAGMTYSDYARRGYFELVAAACLAGGLIVALETTIERRTWPYLALAATLVGATVILLASAALRLQLYQDAYGWTELRLYVAVSIAALGATLAVLAILLLANRTRLLGHAMAVIALASLVGLNLLAPAAFVAARNTERAIDPSLVPADGHDGLDADYLAVLPDDAIPVLVAALPALPADDAVEVVRILRARRTELATDPAYRGVAQLNLGRERARAALETLP